MLYRFSAAISYYCYLFTFLLVYIVLILDCVGYFHRPKKPLIQSRYTHQLNKEVAYQRFPSVFPHCLSSENDSTHGNLLIFCA